MRTVLLTLLLASAWYQNQHKRHHRSQEETPRTWTRGDGVVCWMLLVRVTSDDGHDLTIPVDGSNNVWQMQPFCPPK